MLNIFNNAFKVGTLPPSITCSNITLLPKIGKDPEDSASYRLITLMPVDTKILAKIVACRLQTVLPQVIHPDQMDLLKAGSLLTIKDEY